MRFSIFKISATLILGILVPNLSYGHARLSIPLPRNNNAGLKNGPCGGIARGFSPAVWTVGQTVTINWEETVNHPGKFLFSISTANDAGFVMEKTVLDDKDGGVAMPHLYTTTFVVPNKPCEACTFQMIQSMEENPNNPSFYYSCADIRIVAPSGTPTPTPTTGGGGGNTTQSSNGGANPADTQAQMGGCGTVSSLPPGGGPGAAPMVATLLFMLMTLATYARLRMVPVRARNGRRRP